jgi:hypothetical protein
MAPATPAPNTSWELAAFTMASVPLRDVSLEEFNLRLVDFELHQTAGRKCRYVI